MRTLTELAKTLLALVTVLGATAAGLAGLDAVARALGPPLERVSSVASVELAEKKLGAHLALPAYFPESLGWPPAQVRIARGKPPTVALTFLARDGSGTRMVLFQTVGAQGEVSRELLDSPARVLDSRPVEVGGAPGTLARVQTADGQLWHALGWRHAGQQFVLRTRGTVNEALMMAGSVRRAR